MKKIASGLIAVCLILMTGSIALAESNLIETIADGCKKELQTYCKDVTPGEGRVLACIYAYSDKLSGQCEYALYDAAAQLERAVAALSYVANECAEDLGNLCSSVAIGEGRLLNCLDKNKKKVSVRCTKALEDVSLK